MNLLKRLIGVGAKQANSSSISINKVLSIMNTNDSTLSKIENKFEPVNPLGMLRTIVDDDSGSEDIFKSIFQQAKSKLPDQTEDKKGKITIFMPMDDLLLYSYLPDDNFGMYEMPKLKDYDFKIDLPEYKTFSYIYLRDNLDKFMAYLNENFEPILYTTGEKLYIDKIMNIVDPDNIFKYRLYQDDCHLYKNTKQDVVDYLKDINLFTNRSLKKKILIDNSPLNYILSPDNSIYIFYSSNAY